MGPGAIPAARMPRPERGAPAVRPWSPAPRDAATTDALPLQAATRLFAAFHRAGIHYCHWKSNDKVAAGLAGRSDIDVLIDRSQADQSRTVLFECGFKRFQPMAHTEYPAVEDYLALDEATSRLLHCHVHYRLVVGERFLKGYRLPWESVLLARRRWVAEIGVFVTDEPIELLVLLVRLATKLRIRDVLSFAVREPSWIAELRSERDRLHGQADLDATRELCEQLLGSEACGALEPLLTGQVTLATILRCQWRIRGELSSYRIYGQVRSQLLRWRREWARVVSVLSRRALNLARPVRRSLPSGGMLVAIVGSDESRRLMLVRDVSRLFTWKVDVFRVHLGAAEQRWSLLGLSSWMSRAFLERLGMLDHQVMWELRSGRPLAPRSWSRAIAAGVWGLTHSFDLRRKLRAAYRARNRGVLVIAEQFPQARIAGLHNGPLLTRFATRERGLMRAIARWEAAPYSWAERQMPDLVVQLDGLTVVSSSTEGDADTVSGSVDAHSRVGVAAPPVVLVDATRPGEDVRRDIAQAIWSYL